MFFSLTTVPIAASHTGGDGVVRQPKEIFGYEVVDFVEEGAGSFIYAVRRPKTRQIYALKHVVVKNEKQVRFVDQLVNEFQVGQQLDHPNLRKYYDLKLTRTFFRKPSEAAVIMELIDGAPCETRPPAGVGAMIRVFRQTAQALQAMHEKGFVHCDLKPNNILRSGENVKLIDLGQACPAGSIKKRIQGTPDYMAPEQVRCEPVTVRTDVYNFGATMYWMLSGRVLPTLYTLKREGNSFLVPDAIATPREINPNVPEGLSNLTMECVRLTAAKRPTDMKELTQRLDVIAGTLVN